MKGFRQEAGTQRFEEACGLSYRAVVIITVVIITPAHTNALFLPRRDPCDGPCGGDTWRVALHGSRYHLPPAPGTCTPSGGPVRERGCPPSSASFSEKDKNHLWRKPSASCCSNKEEAGGQMRASPRIPPQTLELGNW